MIITLLALMLIAYATFAVLYGTGSQWRATYQGITLMSQKITMSALVLFYMVDSLIEGYWPGRLVILYILLMALTIEAWATLAGLIHVQQKHKPYYKKESKK